MKSLKNSKILFLSLGLIVSLSLAGCKSKPQSEIKQTSTSPKTDTFKLVDSLEPIKIKQSDGSTKTTTFEQAMHLHEQHEMESGESHEHHNHHEHHICMGTLVGYRSLQFAVNQLYAEELPVEKDLQMSTEFPSDSAIDLFEYCTGNECVFEIKPLPDSSEMFTFSATRLSTGQNIDFKIKNKLIPEDFFILKSQGKTCADPRIQKAKSEGIRNLLSSEITDCFEIIKQQ